MKHRPLPKRSLKTRVSLFTLAIFAISIWSLVLYVSQLLREDLQRLSGEQQAAAVSLVAAGLVASFEDRRASLELVADTIDASLLRVPAATQKHLEQRPLLLVLFNAGVFVTRLDGTAIAELPLLGRAGLNYLDRDHVAAALREAKVTVGMPTIGKTVPAPSFAITVPIRDGRGQVIGALSGVTDLSRPNFLDGINAGRYGHSGGYLIVDPQHRLFVTATINNIDLIMAPLPAPGANPMLDRRLQGFDGPAINVNARGSEVLTSSARIPLAGWIVIATLPTAEAFAPMRAMEQRILLAASVLLLFAGGLIWWMLGRELEPMRTAAKTLATLSLSSESPHPLRIAHEDEVGDLLRGFNHLLDTLRQRDAALRDAHEVLVNTLERALDGYWLVNLEGKLIGVNHSACAMLGYAQDEMLKFSVSDIDAIESLGDIHSRIDRLQAVGSERFESRHRRKDGSEITVEMAISYLSKNRALSVFVRDVTQRKQAEAALRQRERYQRALFDNFPFRVWLKDEHSRYLAVNQAFATAFGWPSADSLIGRSDFDIDTPEIAARRRADDRSVLASGSSLQFEEIDESAGERRTFEIHKAPVTVEGRIVGLVGFARDITARKQTDAALLAASAEAERANHAKSRFLAAASHDLRQPLAALSLYVGLLKTKMAADGGELIASIENCLGSLSELLGDLLDVSKLDAGVVTPRLADFSVDELIATQVSVHAGEATLKGLHLRSRLTKAVARSDPMLLRRLVGNLVSNAIRYSEHGGVLIACRRQGGKRWLEVWDTGIGIAEDQTGLVFEEFRQLGDDARNRGSGLGLAIVAKTAKLLGLEIRLRSRPGRGSMFAVELPPGLAVTPAGTPPRASGVRALRIGLVDDNTLVLRALVLALETAGHEVVAAVSSQALSEGLGGRRPDLLISDYRLAAGETGFDVIEATRKRFGADLPALLITGDTDPALVRSMAGRGIAVHFKPLEIDALMAFIREAAERREA